MSIYSFLKNIDRTCIIYNGSIIPVPNEPDNYYCVYRATGKPFDLSGNQIMMPDFPYMEFSAHLFSNPRNYVGFVKMNKNKNQYNLLLHEKLKQFDGDWEDPRLYIRDNKVFMLLPKYIKDYPCTKPERCMGMYEVDVKQLETSDPMKIQFVCEYIFTQKDEKQISSRFYDVKPNIVKNWSYVPPNFLLDKYNNDTHLYIMNTTPGKPMVCQDIKKDGRYSNLFEPLGNFIQTDWSIALTTPTVEYKNYMYGVLHVKIPYKLMYDNFEKLEINLKYIIMKNDIHHHTYFYLMSYYRFDINNTTKFLMSSPFIITGDSLDDNQYSYNVNFPCGFYINQKNGDSEITFGLGDCILCTDNNNISNIRFQSKKYNYEDLYYIPLDSIYKQYLNRSTINTSISSLNNKIPMSSTLNIDIKTILLPKYIFLIDIRTNGLNFCTYNSIMNTYSNETLCNTITDYNETPSQFLSKNQTSAHINTTRDGNLAFAISNSTILNLWDTTAWKNVSINYENKNDGTGLKQVFGIITKKYTYLHNTNAHHLGIIDYLTNSQNINLIDIPLLTIYTDLVEEHLCFGTNDSLTITKTKHNRKKFTHTYLDSKRLTFVQLISRICKKLKINPTIVTFSGIKAREDNFGALGSGYRTFNYDDKQIHIIPDTNITYRGLVYKMKQNIFSGLIA